MPANFALIPASYVYLRRGNEVLLQLRQNTNYCDGMWAAGAAGHIELHETALDAARREVREELGLDIPLADFDLLTSMQRTDGTDRPLEQRIEWFFTVRQWEGEPRVMEPRKCAELRWFSLDAIPQNTIPHEVFVLHHLAHHSLQPYMHLGYASSTPLS